ncbi:hypothetical protein JCGZ_06268 [Jatropha curcas]|uniref:Late embryogenesis abundant protein LEA-2 subgroup domain-containing protein n=1 Tax=Jatropha curcas TaxID=180498 RepID=A0A067KMA7_JATCU|nr:hypothetical protein JCGZ_06268 [Jatropha curcas]
MAISKVEQQQQQQQQQSPHYYTPIPCQHDQNYIVLPFHHHPTTFRGPSKPMIITIICLLFIPALVYLLWPSDPNLRIVRLSLNKIHIHTLPIINIDVSLYVTIKVRNVDVYSMDLRRLDVALAYRGKRLGHVKVKGKGHVSALGSSYVDTELEFSGVRILSDVVFLLEDLAKGRVPFDTVIKVSGELGFLGLEFPFKQAKMSCEVLVNTNNQTIVRQNCYSDQK